MTPSTTHHEHRLHRRRSVGTVLCAADGAAGCVARGHGRRAQPAVRHLWLGHRVLRSNVGQPAGGRPGQRGADSGCLQPLGRQRGRDSRPQGALGRPRLLRHRPQAPAQHSASALRAGRRDAGVRDRRARRRGLPRCRPDHRRRRPEQPHPREVRRHLPARHRCAPLPLRLARHDQAVRRLHVRARRDRARLVPGPRVSLRRHHRDLHHRNTRACVAPRRARHDGQGKRDRILRAALCRAPRRPCADLEREPPARVFAMDHFPTCRLRALGAPQRQGACRADG